MSSENIADFCLNRDLRDYGIFRIEELSESRIYADLRELRGLFFLCCKCI